MFYLVKKWRLDVLSQFIKGTLYCFTRQLRPTDTESSSSRAENKGNRNLSDGTVTRYMSKENIRLNNCSAHAFPQMSSKLFFSWLFARYVIRSFYRGPRRRTWIKRPARNRVVPVRQWSEIRSNLLFDYSDRWPYISIFRYIYLELGHYALFG